LTIDAAELGDGCCPECLEGSGKRIYEFEEVETPGRGEAAYRCDECGAIVKAPGQGSGD
jgi:hypothetical protein